MSSAHPCPSSATHVTGMCTRSNSTPPLCTCCLAAPPAEDAIEELKRDGITQLVVLPLYPQFSVSTSGSSLRLLEALLKEDPALRQVRAARGVWRGGQCWLGRRGCYAAPLPVEPAFVGQ